MNKNTETQSEGVTWISAQSLIQLQLQASQLSLTNSKVHAKQGGAYLSSFRGRGMEFDESRIYQAGDDIRNMDWRVTARTGTAHCKVFREERERPVLLWLDLNASMMFATRKKYKAVIATEIATLLAWSAAKNNDRIGGLIFAADQHVEIKPRRSKTAVLDFIGRVTKHSAWSDNKAHTEKDTEAAISRLRKVTLPGSLIFMISDFSNISEKAFSQLADIARHNDIVLIKISDPIEVELPPSGSYKITDGINELQIQTSAKKTREQYRKNYTHSKQQLEKFCRQNRMHLIHISTGDNTFEKLTEGLGVQSNNKAQYRSTR
ncbi:MAG: DUF58 domain-containing protein [Gammaproteobacteria bacterium]|nr:DUF58 domain-containing protein [Gammaproteobacteria bacterium]